MDWDFFTKPLYAIQDIAEDYYIFFILGVAAGLLALVYVLFIR